MRFCVWTAGCATFALAVSLVSASAQQQPVDPFAMPPADQPIATAVPADQAGAADQPPPVDLSQYGPAVRAVLAQERTTPEELLEGVLLLVELGEPELARSWLDRLLQAPPDAQAQAELARRLGTHRLMRLASADALGEDARNLATSMMGAYAAEVRDPARLSKLIGQLAAPDANVRYAAVAGLVEAGDRAAAALVAALDEAQSDAHRTWMQIALAELAPASVGPLLAGLDADAAVIRAESAAVLGRVAPGHLADRLMAAALVDEDPQVRQAASEALSRIVGHPPTRDTAERALREVVEQLLHVNRPLAEDEAGRVEVWYWDTASQAPAVARLTPDQARVTIASQLARDLVTIVPTSLEYRTQDAMLQHATGGLGQPRDAGPEATDVDQARWIAIAALEEALRVDLPRAIIGAARELAAMPGAEAILLSHAPAESPLVRALRHPDTAVRWAALAAIMALDPQTPYPGASRVTRTLGDFVEAGGRPRAVVALLTIEQARNLAATVDRLGYEVALATSGREAILAAAESGGADVLLVDARISRPTLREVLYQIRANPSSSGAAIGVLGTGASLDRAREAAADHPNVQAFPHPWELSGGEVAVAAEGPAGPATDLIEEVPVPPRVVLDEEAVQTMLERLAGGDAGAAADGAPTRQEMARQALGWLGELLARDDTFYDVRRYEPVVLRAADRPHLTETAVDLLAHLGSHESQLRLVNLASARAAPIELRQEAAEAFRVSAARYGVQLTTSEILRQYDRYNASETADRPTQLVLGDVLDTIERKRLQTAGGE